MKESKVRARIQESYSKGARVLERACARAICSMRARLVCQRGQGTTEYAILVGVLVVIAILAITIFKPKIEELWNAITTGIQGL